MYFDSETLLQTRRHKNFSGAAGGGIDSWTETRATSVARPNPL